MKKALALILAFVMCLALCACGSKTDKTPSTEYDAAQATTPSKDNTPAESTQTPETEKPEPEDDEAKPNEDTKPDVEDVKPEITDPEPEVEPTPESKAIQVTVGDKIENDLFIMTVDSFDFFSEQSVLSTDFDYLSDYIEPGYKLAMIQGTFENLSTSVIEPLFAFYLKFTMNGTFIKENFDVMFIFLGGNSLGVDPYISANYAIYTQVPEKLAEQFENAVISINYNDDFSSALDYADNAYEIVIGASTSDKPKEEYFVYYDELSTLPTVDSTVSAEYSGKSETISVGAPNKVVYKYTGKSGLDASGLIDAYLEAIKDSGFTYKGSTDSEVSIIENETIVATAYIEFGEMCLYIIPEDLRISSVTNTIAIGDVITTADYELTLKKVEFSYEVLPVDTSSVYSCYPADSGKVYIHVAADVKNLMQRDIRIEELFTASALYDGKYQYSGFTVVDDGNRFDWVGSYVAATPLETCGAHCLIECPVEVHESGKSVTVTLLIGNVNYEYTLK